MWGIYDNDEVEHWKQGSDICDHAMKNPDDFYIWAMRTGATERDEELEKRLIDKQNGESGYTY